MGRHCNPPGATLARMSNDGALLLAIDVGNTNISFGLFDEARALRADWRMETRSGRTADEYFAILKGRAIFWSVEHPYRSAYDAG